MGTYQHIAATIVSKLMDSFCAGNDREEITKALDLSKDMMEMFMDWNEKLDVKESKIEDKPEPVKDVGPRYEIRKESEAVVKEESSDKVLFDFENSDHKKTLIAHFVKNGMILSNKKHIEIAQDICKRCHGKLDMSTVESFANKCSDKFPNEKKEESDVPW